MYQTNNNKYNHIHLKWFNQTELFTFVILIIIEGVDF